MGRNVGVYELKDPLQYAFSTAAAAIADPVFKGYFTNRAAHGHGEFNGANVDRRHVRRHRSRRWVRRRHGGYAVASPRGCAGVNHLDAVHSFAGDKKSGPPSLPAGFLTKSAISYILGAGAGWFLISKRLRGSQSPSPPLGDRRAVQALGATARRARESTATESPFRRRWTRSWRCVPSRTRSCRSP